MTLAQVPQNMCLNSVLNVKALVLGAFNLESLEIFFVFVIVKLNFCEGLLPALACTGRRL